MSGDAKTYKNWQYNALRMVKWVVGTAELGTSSSSVADLFENGWQIIVAFLMRPRGTSAHTSRSRCDGDGGW
jgi:hypothetical protein